MRILIIRHGEPNYEKDVLTERGNREAQLLADKLEKEKIDYIYCSPLGRAKETCAHVAKRLGKENEVVVKDWLQEFGSFHVLPSGEEKHIFWDMLPEFWTECDEMYSKEKWLEQDFYRSSEMGNRYRYVIESLDALLESHGYVRKGRLYETEQGNHDTIAFFCHLGLEGVLLSHLCNISPILLTQQFCATTSSLTTLYTEERRKGKAVFRCTHFGDTGHLYAAGEEPNFLARFCEVYEDDARHD